MGSNVVLTVYALGAMAMLLALAAYAYRALAHDDPWLPPVILSVLFSATWPLGALWGVCWVIQAAIFWAAQQVSMAVWKMYRHREARHGK